MIPEAAVEAAALALYERDYGVTDWGIVTSEVKGMYLEEARAALEAAAPHMHTTNQENTMTELEQCPENHGYPDPHHDHITDGSECWCSPGVITVEPAE